jgi:hypothetical protein
VSLNQSVPSGVVPFEVYLVIEEVQAEYNGTVIECVITFFEETGSCNTSASDVLEVAETGNNTKYTRIYYLCSRKLC